MEQTGPFTGLGTILIHRVLEFVRVRGILPLSMPAPRFGALSLRETSDGTEVPIRVVPKAKRNSVAGLWQSALKVQVAAVPRDGKANDELCAYLARLFGLSRRSVRVRSGERSRDKVVFLAGINAEKVRSLLAELK